MTVPIFIQNCVRPNVTDMSLEIQKLNVESFCPSSSWMDIQVKGTSLPKALHCWERSLQENNHSNHNHPINKSPPKRGCPSRVIDSCSWPHCNPTCPKIYDEQTGQEMGMIQFLKHMGFDVTKMAQQQGMDPRTLLSLLSNGS